MELGRVYFWTATINKWHHLMKKDQLKDIVIDSLQYLSILSLIEVYGFVVMPNHIHLIWRMLAKNGKEQPAGSFLKYTAHMFKRYLKNHIPSFLESFIVDALNKRYEFWQQNPYAFELTKMRTALQKLNYIHNNPVSKHWCLSETALDYRYSSARFYEYGIDEFGFLRSINEIF